MLFDVQKVWAIYSCFLSNSSMMVHIHSESVRLPNMTGEADAYLGTGYHHMNEGFYYTSREKYYINKDDQLQKNLKIQKVTDIYL